MVNPFSIFFSRKFDSRGHNCPFWPPSGHFGGHIISMEHSYRHGYQNRGKSTWQIHFYHFYVNNITIDGIIDLSDLQVVILEVILYQWSTYTRGVSIIHIYAYYRCIVELFSSKWCRDFNWSIYWCFVYHWSILKYICVLFFYYWITLSISSMVKICISDIHIFPGFWKDKFFHCVWLIIDNTSNVANLLIFLGKNHFDSFHHFVTENSHFSILSVFLFPRSNFGPELAL